MIEHLKKPFQGYIHFIRTQGIAGFAIGFILGKAVSDLVGSFVNDIINPLIGIIFTGFDSLAELSFHVGDSVIAYGKFLGFFINFLILAAVVYFGIKKLAPTLDRPKDAPVVPPDSAK